MAQKDDRSMAQKDDRSMAQKDDMVEKDDRALQKSKPSKPGFKRTEFKRNADVVPMTPPATKTSFDALVVNASHIR